MSESFLASYDTLLLFNRKRVPALHIVQILLDDNVAAADERGVFAADDRGFDGAYVARVLGAVDESDQIACVEVTEAVRFVVNRNRPGNAFHAVGHQLEAHVHARRANVQQHVTRGRHRMSVRCTNLAKRVQFRRSRHSEKLIPNRRSKADRAGKPGFRIARAHGADESGQIGGEGPHGRRAIAPRFDARDQEHRRVRKRRKHRLRERCSIAAVVNSQRRHRRTSFLIRQSTSKFGP